MPPSLMSLLFQKRWFPFLSSLVVTPPRELSAMCDVAMQNRTSERIMTQATAHPDRRLISSEDVQGTDVYGIGDEAIGQIDHLLIEKISGRVAYAVMSFGGFLGLAHSHYPIPWSALKYDTALQGYRTGITESQLKDAPAFSDDSWMDRDWETRTHQHYGAPTYWGA